MAGCVPQELELLLPLSLWCPKVDLPYRKTRRVSCCPPTEHCTDSSRCCHVLRAEGEWAGIACLRGALPLSLLHLLSVFLSQVKDASWKTQASCDNTLSNLYSTKPFRAGKVNWGSNWLIRCLALSTASVQTQHGETQPGAARSCRAAPCTEAGHSRHQARNGLLSYPTQSVFSVWKKSDKKQAGSQGQAPPSAAWSHSPWGSAFQTAASPSSQSSRLAGRLPSISL